jgi:hypothetical protein
LSRSAGLGTLRSERLLAAETSLSKQWAKFFADLGQVEAQIEAVALECLQEGRAFCIYQGEFGPALHAPDYWRRQSDLKGHSKSQFLLSGKLPRAWLNMHMKNTEIEERRNKVAVLRWLQSEYRHLARLGKKMTKAEVKTELAKRFGIEMLKLQMEIWREALQSKWSKSGAQKSHCLKYLK